MTNIVSKPSRSLDLFDKAILQIVQRNNQLTHTKIGAEVGLSESAVRRRLAALRSQGVIKRDISILDSDQFGVTLIVQVTFKDDTKEAYAAFDNQMNELINVKQSYHVSGAIDYVLIVHGPSLQWFEDWAKDNIMTNLNVRRHETSVVWSCKKFETAVTL